MAPMRSSTTVCANVNPTDLPNSARVARKLLKLVAIPTIVLAVVVRFTIPPSTWWIDGVFIGLCVVVIVLLVIGRVPIHGNTPSNDSAKEPADHR